MVRIKHRYLLFNILYPAAPTSSSVPAPPSTSKEATPPSYILFLRPSPGYLTPALLVTHLRSQIQTLFGDHGLSVTQSSLRLVYFSPATSTGILRVPRAHFRLVWASLTFLTSIPPPPPPSSSSRSAGGGTGRRMGERGADGDATARPELACVVRVVRVSGTIRKSEEELLRRARREVVRAKLQGRSLGEEGGNTGLEAMFAGGKRQLKGKGKLTAAGFMDGEESIVGFDEENDDDFENDSG